MSGPYNNSYTVVYQGGETSLESNNIPILPSANDVIHTVKDGESLHSIAYQYYKDSGKWYIIAEANHIFNPLRDVVSGIKLKIPRYGI